MWYKEYIKYAENPDWNGKHYKCHNWRNYVTKQVQELWTTIPLVGRCAVIACCQEMADNETWD